jgi:hypothetical protein
VVLLLWANTFSPFGMNRQNGYFEWNISPFLTTFSPLASKTWVKIIPKTESCSERRRRMSYGVEWKPLSSPKTPIPFQYTYDLVWNPLENTLVIAYIKEIWSKVYLWAMCAKHQKKFLESRIFSSCLSLLKVCSSSGLVKISANWSLVLIYAISISPFYWWSLRKWYRMAMCLVRLCSTGLSTMRIALSISHRRGTLVNL